MALLLTACLLPAKTTMASEVDFWCKWPTSWQDRKDTLGNDLVRQYVSPDGNAFIEVYAARGQNPGVQRLADTLEQAILENGGLYFQNRMKSMDTKAGGTVPAVLREYSGIYNGVLLHAFALYAYGNGGAVTVIGVFPENMTEKYWDTVYQCVVSLRFEPPEGVGGTTNPPTPPPAAPNVHNAIVGKWKWFTGSSVDIQPGGILPGKGNSWQCINPNQRVYLIIWNNGQWVDTLTLSPDGTRLEGENQNGNRVWGQRVSGPPAPAVPGDAGKNLAGPPPAKNYARKISGNMGANWKLAHGSMNTATPAWNAEWELSTVSGVTLHCRDPYNKGKQRYLVRVYDRTGQHLIDETEVGMLAKIRLQPGIYRIKSIPLNGYAGWNCAWE